MATNTERAQMGRINRRLAQEGRTLRKVRDDSRWFAQYGPFQVVDIATNTLVSWGITDLDELEAELKRERQEAENQRVERAVRAAYAALDNAGVNGVSVPVAGQ